MSEVAQFSVSLDSPSSTKPRKQARLEAVTMTVVGRRVRQKAGSWGPGR
jgi:hypothetical protein